MPSQRSDQSSSGDGGGRGDDRRLNRARAVWTAKTLLAPVRGWVNRKFHPGPVRRLRRLTPASRKYGFDRGKPIDRYYIEHFLGRFADSGLYGSGDFQGRVLEIGGDDYVRLFGGIGVGASAGMHLSSGGLRLGYRARGAVERVDVFDLPGGNPQATIVGDLTREEDLPADTFDLVICTQLLLVIYDFRAALRSLHRALKPGGVLLVTTPGIQAASKPDVDLWGDYWRFTSRSIRRLLEELFPAENVTVDAYGNVLAAAAALYGVASQELRAAELELRDRDYEVIIGARAVKAAG